MNKRIWIFLNFLLGPFIINAQTSIDVHPDLRKGVLSNGLTYYIMKNEMPKNVISIRLATQVGSILETEEERGLAHFVEHMAFNGSENFKKNELVDYLEKTGTRFGPDLNAYTSFDETVYILDIKADDPEMVNKGLLIFEDWAGRLSFDEEEIDKERGVVIAELRGSLGPRDRMSKVIYPVLFKGSNYAERLPIGLESVIQNADYEKVRNFYRKWYRPELMALIIVGDFDVDQMEAQVKNRFSFLKNPNNPVPRMRESLPLEVGKNVKIASDKEANMTTVELIYRHKSKLIKNEEDYKERIIRSLYNNMISSRLSDYTKKPDAPFTIAFTGYGKSVGDIDSYRSTAFTTPDKIVSAVEALVIENRRVQLHGFHDSEFKRAKSALLKNLEKAVNEKDQVESRILASRLVSHYLQNNPFLSPEQELELTNKLLNDISLDDLNAIVKKWVRPNDWILTVTAPQSDDKPLPTEAKLMEIVDVKSNENPEPYKDIIIPRKLLIEAPRKAFVTYDKYHLRTGIYEWVFSNGARVYFKPTKLKNDEVVFAAQSYGGYSLLNNEDLLNSELSTAIVEKSGVGQFSGIQLEKYLADKIVRLNPYLSLYTEGFSGLSSPRDLEDFFQYLNLYMRFPMMYDNEAIAALNEEKAFRQNDLENPDYYFNYMANKIKTNDHPRFRYTQAEDLDKIDLRRSYLIFKERFKCPDEFVYVFAGNVDPKVLRDYIATYIASIESCNEPEKPFFIKTMPDNTKKKHVFYKGTAEKAIAEGNYQGDFAYSPRNRRIMDIAIAIANIKLRERIREDLGGVYGIRMFGNADKHGNRFNLSFRYTADPEKLEVLMTESLKVLDTLIIFGPQEADIEKVKAQQIQGWKVDSQQNRWWVSNILSRVMDNEDFNAILLEDLDDFWSTVTKDEIRDMIRKIMDPSLLIQIMMYPEQYEDKLGSNE